MLLVNALALFESLSVGFIRVATSRERFKTELTAGIEKLLTGGLVFRRRSQIERLDNRWRDIEIFLVPLNC